MISRETLLVYSTRLRRKHTRNWPKIHVGGPIVILQLLFHFLQLLFPFLLASWPWPPLLPVLILLLLCTRVQSLSWHSSSSTSSRKLVLASHDILPPRAMVWTWDPFQMKTSSCHALKRKRCQLNQSANLPNYNCPVTSSSSQQPEPPELQLSQVLSSVIHRRRIVLVLVLQKGLQQSPISKLQNTPVKEKRSFSKCPTHLTRQVSTVNEKRKELLKYPANLPCEVF